jgi:acylphosphatase
MLTLHLLIKGKVQGVFYRATAKDVAEHLGLRGWIKNREDDNVEATVTGTEEQTEQFIVWCKKGPRRAAVSDVIVTEIPLKDFDEFKIVKS